MDTGPVNAILCLKNSKRCYIKDPEVNSDPTILGSILNKIPTSYLQIFTATCTVTGPINAIPWLKNSERGNIKYQILKSDPVSNNLQY